MKDEASSSPPSHLNIKSNDDNDQPNAIEPPLPHLFEASHRRRRRRQDETKQTADDQPYENIPKSTSNELARAEGSRRAQNAGLCSNCLTENVLSGSSSSSSSARLGARVWQALARCSSPPLPVQLPLCNCWFNSFFLASFFATLNWPTSCFRSASNCMRTPAALGPSVSLGLCDILNLN